MTIPGAAARCRPLAGLLVVATVLATVVAGLAASPASYAGKGRAHPPGPRPEKTYLYDVTFTAKVHHAYRLVAGPGSSTWTVADADIEGRIPGVYVTRRSAFSANPLKAGLTTATGGVSVVKLDDDGRSQTTCDGESVPYDEYQLPGLSLGRDGRGGRKKTHLYPFQGLSLPMTCTGPGGVTNAQHVLPGLGLPLVGRGFRAGRQVFHQRFRLELAYTADPSDQPCPDEQPGSTEYCDYTIDARATFRLRKAPTP